MSAVDMELREVVAAVGHFHLKVVHTPDSAMPVVKT